MMRVNALPLRPPAPLSEACRSLSCTARRSGADCPAIPPILFSFSTRGFCCGSAPTLSVASADPGPVLLSRAMVCFRRIRLFPRLP